MTTKEEVVKGLKFIKDKLEGKVPIIPLSFDRTPLCVGWGINGPKWVGNELSDCKDKFGNDGWLNNNFGGIGLLCGPRSGIIAVDFDLTDDEIKKQLGKFHYKSLRIGQPDRFGVAYYKYSDKFPAKTKHRVKSGFVEILTNGQYVAIAPSWHPKINAPYYDKGAPLYNCFDDLIEIPDYLCEYLQEISLDEEESDSNFGDLGKDRCRHGSHNAISAVLIAMVKRGETFEFIKDELLELDRKENADADCLYFKCPSRNWKYKTVEENCSWLINDALKRHNEVLPEESISVEILEEEIEPEIKLKSLILPESGLGKGVYDYILENAPIPNKNFSIAATLSFFSMMAANTCQFNGTLANNYIVIQVPSTGGKDYYLRIPQRLLGLVAAEGMIGYNRYASGVSMIEDLTENPARLDTTDEISSLFSSFNDKNNYHNSSKEMVLLELYSASGKFFAGQRSVGRGITGRCFSPYVCLMGATTTKGLKSITEENITNGLGSRIWLFQSDENPQFNYEMVRNPLSHNLALRLCNLRPDIPKPKKESDIVDLCQGISKGLFPAYYRSLREYKYDGEFPEITGRSTETFNKLIVVGHVMMEEEGYLEEEVKQSTMEWAYKNTIILCQNTLSLLEKNVSFEHTLLNVKIKIHAYLKKHPGKSKEQIGSRFRTIDGVTRSKAIQDLSDSGSIKKKGILFYAVGKF